MLGVQRCTEDMRGERGQVSWLVIRTSTPVRSNIQVAYELSDVR